MSSISKILTENTPTFDIASLTKRGIKRVLLTPKSDVIFDGLPLLANKEYDISFPELNGTLPSRIKILSAVKTWECGCRVMELAGKGNADYFGITKENNNGVPT